MARPPRGSDLLSVLRGLSRVGSAVVDVRSQEVTKAWATSSLRPLIVQGSANLQEAISKAVQQPQVVQTEASKGVSEALARISMVGEGLRAYRSGAVPAAADLSSQVETAIDPMYDPEVQELNIEEIMMQEAWMGHEEHKIPEHTAVDKQMKEAIVGARNIRDSVMENAKEARSSIQRRMEEFEPLLDVSKVEEKEITDDQLQALQEKLDELKGASFGQNMKMLSDIQEHSRPMEEVLQEVIKDQTGLQDMVLQEVATEQTAVKEELRQEVIPEQTAVKEEIKQEVIPEQTAVKEELRQEVATKQTAVKDELIQEVLPEQTAVKEELIQELKSEQIAVKEELIQEVMPEQTAVKEELIQEVMPEQTAVKEELIQEVMPEQSAVKEELILELKSEQTAIKEEIRQEAIPDEAVFKGEVVQEVVIEHTSFKEEVLAKPSTFESVSVKKEVEKELDSTLAQVAKTINLEETNTSTIQDFDVELQAKPAICKDEAEKVVIKASPESSGTNVDTSSTVEDFIVPSTVGSGPAAAASISGAAVASVSMAAASTAAAAATVAASVAASASAVATQSVALEEKPKPAAPKPKLLGRKPLAKDKPKSTLASNAQARKVPHSRIGRLMSFGGLAAGLGAGTLAELTRRSLGMNEGKGSGSLLDASPFLTEANAKRIVDTLCRVRGAALKLGQMLSIQDNALINPQLQKIFERVRQSADFMPAWQLENALVDQFGPDWRSLVTTFDERPFAAASIGQVHLATLPDGRSVAMKIQYPGVAEGIDSDINNLIGTLKIANILPEGLYVDSVIEVAKKELNWECDYIREAECTTRFRELVKPYPEYYVPEVISQLCTKQVFSSELIDGVPVDKCIEMDQETRNYICEKILRLCLLELFKFGFMQTDPNWSNFFYNAETEQLALLDFGACRSYEKSFVDKYIQIIHGAATCNREKIYEYSKQLGFLTGHEAKVMIDAHIDAVMILGEAFQDDKLFHFGAQDTTYRIQHLVPVMLSHRMCAPPEESYSLHRKMSGVFLLCARLNGQVNCRPLFDEAFDGYKYGGTWEDFHAGRL
ncbi:atypical kinase COQ8A, mitochondrial-like [Penaeus chinensis]|uniref:atypical kinase COQ8A, mitochondrial-like n=1 Tax=Penaeus chinensis TaxID=139456 RepID=UPI001FB596D6|nr:atypical kinase COQ8A, mitochondrial-like [Penaeus chinensis]